MTAPFRFDYAATDAAALVFCLDPCPVVDAAGVQVGMARVIPYPDFSGFSVSMPDDLPAGEFVVQTESFTVSDVYGERSRLVDDLRVVVNP